MNSFRTFLALLSLALIVVFSQSSCKKETPLPIVSESLDQVNSQFLTDWYSTTLSLVPQINGFSEPVAARAMSIISYTMYECSAPALTQFRSLQNQVNGLNTSLPAGEGGLNYHYGIVSNEALATITEMIFGVAGQESMAKVHAVQAKWQQTFSSNIDETVLNNSIDLGRKLAWAIYKYTTTDGQEYAYLKNFPEDYSMPAKAGMWVPTPPDYSPKPLLPYWGQVRMNAAANQEIPLTKSLSYSQDPTSVIYAEANEVFAKTSNLSSETKELIEYYNKAMDPHASAFCHTSLLMLQLLEQEKLDYTKTLAAICRLSWAQHDAYVASFKLKYNHNLLRPSTYIRSHISRFYVPPVSSSPSPDYVSESAAVYFAASEILSSIFGHRYEFMDYTQNSRTTLRNRLRHFNSFSELATEASYIEISAGTQFRTSIAAGADLGFDIAKNILNIQLIK
ncbi:MAG TPA: hypothetical protein PK006_02250 [Saprospiraceae bacterium]|nr:hypothetical protein [Saprospiraceae bacterium]